MGYFTKGMGKRGNWDSDHIYHQTHPSVADSLVFGMEDPEVQELVSAVVVLKDGCEVIK